MTRVPKAGACVLALWAASAPACRPRPVDRGNRVVAGDAASGSPGGPGNGRNDGANGSASTGGSGGNGGSGGSGGLSGSDSGTSGAGGVVVGSPFDAPRDVLSAVDTAPPPDVARDLSPAELTVNALLARTPPNCAMRLSPDIPLTAPAGDAAPAETAAICGLNGAVYWVADMDIDCDGRNTPGTRCANVTHNLDTFAHTASGAALAASVTPYVVVPGNVIIPGLRAGVVVAVINQLTKQMTYAVFGDTSSTSIGGASSACAERVGIDPGPLTGGQRGRTVVYIAFTSANAVPADIENQGQTTQIGQTLTAQFIAANR